VAAVHGSFLSQRVDEGSKRESQGSSGDAEGDPRPGGPHGGPGKGSASSGMLTRMELRDAAELVNAGIEETLSYFDFRENTGGVCEFSARLRSISLQD
jgi:hypothetical protein